MTRPTAEAARAKAESARGSRFSALTYGPLLWWGERSGNAERRRELLASARGSVLEIGAGTGHNLPHYSNDLERLVLTEPERNMARRLEGSSGSFRPIPTGATGSRTCERHPIEIRTSP